MPNPRPGGWPAVTLVLSLLTAGCTLSGHPPGTGGKPRTKNQVIDLTVNPPPAITQGHYGVPDRLPIRDSGRVGAWRPGVAMSVQILLMCALEWLSTLAGNDRAVLLWSPPGAGLAAARALLAVWRGGPRQVPCKSGTRGIDGAGVTRR